MKAKAKLEIEIEMERGMKMHGFNIWGHIEK